jgi:hypothetical protein
MRSIIFLMIFFLNINAAANNIKKKEDSLCFNSKIKILSSEFLQGEALDVVVKKLTKKNIRHSIFVDDQEVLFSSIKKYDSSKSIKIFISFVAPVSEQSPMIKDELLSIYFDSRYRLVSMKCEAIFTQIRPLPEAGEEATPATFQ